MWLSWRSGPCRKWRALLVRSVRQSGETSSHCLRWKITRRRQPEQSKRTCLISQSGTVTSPSAFFKHCHPDVCNIPTADYPIFDYDALHDSVGLPSTSLVTAFNGVLAGLGTASALIVILELFKKKTFSNVSTDEPFRRSPSINFRMSCS